MAGLDVSRSLCGHVPNQRRAVCPRPFIAGASQHRRRSQRPLGLRSLPSFPHSGCPDRLQAPKTPVGWICLAVGLFWMLIAVGDQYEAEGTVVIDALTQAIWVPPIGLLGIYLILLFPDGKLPSRRWRPLAWLSGVVMVLA